MPEPFESNVFDPATTSLMKSALEAALLKCKPSRADENQTRTLLASAIIDLVNGTRERFGAGLPLALHLHNTRGTGLAPVLGQGAVIGQHGSWNRNPRSGYKVIFVPFADGHPTGPPVDVLTGFLSPADEARGRPVGVAFDKSDALLVADDVGNSVWRVTLAK